jgi:AcrR family transcriptional regulator
MRAVNVAAEPTVPRPAAAAGAPQTSRERMIEAAIRLLRGSGLTGAGINQVIAASGAPKGSMYHHFPGGKMELAQAALERYGERVAERLAADMAGPAPAAEKIRGIFSNSAKALAHGQYARGCGIGAVTLDLDEETVQLAPVCARVLASWHAAIAGGLKEIPEPRRGELARFVVTSLQGAQIQSRAARDHRTLLEAGELVAQLIALPLTEPDHAGTNPPTKPGQQHDTRGPRKGN